MSSPNPGNNSNNQKYQFQIHSINKGKSKTGQISTSENTFLKKGTGLAVESYSETS